MPNESNKPNLRNKSGQAKSATKSASGAMASIEEFLVPLKPIDEEQFKKADTDKKLDMMASALNKLCDTINTKIDSKLDNLQKKIDAKIDPLWETVYQEETGLKDVVNKLEKSILDEEDGLKSKVISLEKAADEMNTSFQELTKELDTVKYEQDILKGYIGKHADHILALQEKDLELTAKLMEKNIVITGIPEQPNEDCVQLVRAFLEDELRLVGIETNELYKIKQVFRIGSSLPDRPRGMVVKCNLFLKRKILEAAKEYKERLGHTTPKYFINPQLPDKLVEQNRLVRHLIWEQKQRDEGRPFEQKAKIAVQNNVVFINKQPVKTKLPKVKPHHMFQDQSTQEKLEDIDFKNSDPKTERNSTFQAFATKCQKPEDAHLFQVRIRQLYPEATHIITAYNPEEDSGKQFAFQDDGEWGAGLKLVRAMKSRKHEGVVVCITRIYGGIHMGPRRFQIMQELAYQALDKLD